MLEESDGSQEPPGWNLTTRAAVRLTGNGADDAGHRDGRAKKRHGQNSYDDKQCAHRPTSLSPAGSGLSELAQSGRPSPANSKREATHPKPAG